MNRLIASILFCANFGIFAQSYTFSHATNTYTELDNPILLSPEDEVWDDPDFSISLPFNFQYFGVDQGSFFSQEDLGTILYGSLGSTTPMFIPVNCDVIDLGHEIDSAQSSISYQVVGATGTRILKVQWKNVGFYDNVIENAVPTDSMNFQVWFYEGSNRIEIRFGSSHITDPLNFFELPGPGIFLVRSFDLDMETITPSYYLYGNPASPTMELTSDLEVLSMSHLDGMPANGQTYIFTPFTEPVSEVENWDLQNLTVYPNPANDLISIGNSGALDVLNIQVMDLAGRFVKSFENLTEALSIEDLTPGSYFVRISTNRGVTNKSFSKI